VQRSTRARVPPTAPPALIEHGLATHASVSFPGRLVTNPFFEPSAFAARIPQTDRVGSKLPELQRQQGYFTFPPCSSSSGFVWATCGEARLRRSRSISSTRIGIPKSAPISSTPQQMSVRIRRLMSSLKAIPLNPCRLVRHARLSGRGKAGHDSGRTWTTAAARGGG
jgi:hypothetical protein